MEPLRNILKIRRKSAPSIGGATSTESDESQRQIKGYLKIQDGHSKMFGKRYSATSAEIDASQCKFSGYLKIQGKRRYVIVSEGCLNVYLNENAKNLKKSYPICAFERVTPYDRVTPYENDYTFKLTFREANRPPIVCSCKSSQNRTEWVRQIDTAISFGGESGFESSEMLQHKTPDIHTTISKGNDDFHPGYSTVNQSKLYKAKQDATGTEEDPSYFRTTLVKDNEHLDLFYSTVDESRLYKTKHNVTGTSENPSSESEGKPFMPEPCQTGMTTNVQVECLQTDKKGGIPRREMSYPSILSLPTLMEEGIPRREIRLPTLMEETWLNCFRYSRNFEKDAKKLLLKGMLPDDILLQNICQKYGRKSEVIRYITSAICQNIKEQSNNIVQVWPAFQYRNDLKNSETHIVFVVIMETHTDIKTGYQIYERNVNKILSVSEKENYCIRVNEKLSDVRINDITLCLKSNASKLMETHKNLTCVTISRVKSSRHGMENRIVKSLCIALYVQVKGFIPIDEDPFEQFIDGYPVDVREGVFTLCGSPTELHYNVRMGCALDSGFGTNQGTIGPFFRYQTDPYTYLLTSAHVLLDPEQMKKLIVDNEVHYGMFGTDTYQPPESISVEHNSRHHLGKLEFAVYRKGEQYKPGMEVALIRINKDRIPTDGKFPSKSGSTDGVHGFYAGGICSYSTLLNDPYVYKFGSVTGLTKGRVRLQGASVRTSILYGKSLGLDITLHDQIEIEPVDGVAFGELGDSGSLVFQKDGNRLAAVGIFEGKVNNDTYMVTPMLEIKQALSELMSRYRDPPTDATMDVDEHNSVVTFMLYHVPPSSNVSLSAGIDRQISAEISRQTTEIQTNILHHTDHKIGSVKAELTAVKAHIDSTKREIIENISSQITAMTQTIMSNRLQME